MISQALTATATKVVPDQQTLPRQEPPPEPEQERPQSPGHLGHLTRSPRSTRATRSSRSTRSTRSFGQLTIPDQVLVAVSDINQAAGPGQQPKRRPGPTSGTSHRTLRAFSQQRQKPLPVLLSDLYYRSTRSTRSTRLTRSTISTRPDSRDKISSPRHSDPDRDPDGDRDGDCDRHRAKSARAPPGQTGSPVPTRWSCRSTGTDHDQDQMITIPQICYTSATLLRSLGRSRHHSTVPVPSWPRLS